jgi:hypothetical protein
MEQHMTNLENPSKKKLGKAGGRKLQKATAKPAPDTLAKQAPKEGLKHFVTLTRAGKSIHFIPAHVTKVRMVVAQDGHQTDIQDRSGRTQVKETLEEVQAILGLNWVKLHRHNEIGDPHEVFFVAEQVCRVKELQNPNPTERTVVTDSTGDTSVMEPEDVVLRAIDNALD